MPDSKQTCVMALCGKGGVGKTALSAAIVKILMDNPDNRVLAIDADPAVGLAAVLGIRVEKTVDDIRNNLVDHLIHGSVEDKEQMLSRLDYEMFSAIKETKNLAFLAIGRPEKEGCYCQVNHLLKEIIASIAMNFDYVIIDGEAGVEQVNRRVMEQVSHLILVSDGSVRGLNVACTIKSVLDATIEYRQTGLILNRIKDESEMNEMTISPDMNSLGSVPEDDIIRQRDMAGKSILDLGESPVFNAVRSCLAVLGVITQNSVLAPGDVIG